MKRILVPTDFSEQSKYALKAAAKIASLNNCEIYILHMLDIPDLQSFSGVKTDIPEIIFFKKTAESKLDEFASHDCLKNITTYSLLRLMKTFEGVQEVNQEFAIDLVVMGSHGASGMKEFIIGSNTEKVVRTSEVPVLVIKGQNENLKFENFTFASDFETKNKQNFYKAVELTKSFGANLNLLYINTPSNFTSNEHIENKFTGFEIDYPKVKHHIYNDYTIEKGIINFNNKNHIDLTIMNTHGRKGIAHFFNGSISEDLVNHSNRPILTYRL